MGRPASQISRTHRPTTMPSDNAPLSPLWSIWCRAGLVGASCRAVVFVFCMVCSARDFEEEGGGQGGWVAQASCRALASPAAREVTQGWRHAHTPPSLCLFSTHSFRPFGPPWPPRLHLAPNAQHVPPSHLTPPSHRARHVLRARRPPPHPPRPSVLLPSSSTPPWLPWPSSTTTKTTSPAPRLRCVWPCPRWRASRSRRTLPWAPSCKPRPGAICHSSPPPCAASTVGRSRRWT